MKRHLLRLLLAGSVVVLAGCAHREAQSYGGGGVPLGIVDCYDSGDIYGSGYGPCTGFVYGDYEQYPSFTPLAIRQAVTLTGDRHHATRVVNRSGFDAPSGDVSSSSSSSSSTMSASSSPPPSAPAPRMDPAPVSAPAAPAVVSRPH